MKFIEDFKYIRRNFGVKTAVKLVALPRLCYHIGFKKNNLYIKNLLKWQRKLVSGIIKNYKERSDFSEEVKNYKIWTCWWQGEENMPDVIKECRKSLLRNANGHEVILISKNNYKEFVELPEFLLKKLDSGMINLSNFSDILRSKLLWQYGGIWIDAAAFVIKPLYPKLPLDSPKTRYEYPSICRGKWTFSILFVKRNHLLFSFMYDCLTEFWEKYDAPIEYLAMDGFMRIAYEEFPQIKKEINEIEVNSPDFFSSRYTFDKPIDKDVFNNLVENNTFLSLTWRKDYPKILPDGRKTFYGELLERYS